MGSMILTFFIFIRSVLDLFCTFDYSYIPQIRPDSKVITVGYQDTLIIAIIYLTHFTVVFKFHIRFLVLHIFHLYVTVCYSRVVTDLWTGSNVHRILNKKPHQSGANFDENIVITKLSCMKTFKGGIASLDPTQSQTAIN